jgi:hypothetical protein
MFQQQVLHAQQQQSARHNEGARWKEGGTTRMIRGTQVQVQVDAAPASATAANLYAQQQLQNNSLAARIQQDQQMLQEQKYIPHQQQYLEASPLQTHASQVHTNVRLQLQHLPKQLPQKQQQQVQQQMQTVNNKKMPGRDKAAATQETQQPAVKTIVTQQAAVKTLVTQQPAVKPREIQSVSQSGTCSLTPGKGAKGSLTPRKDAGKNVEKYNIKSVEENGKAGGGGEANEKGGGEANDRSRKESKTKKPMGVYVAPKPIVKLEPPAAVDKPNAVERPALESRESRESHETPPASVTASKASHKPCDKKQQHKDGAVCHKLPTKKPEALIEEKQEEASVTARGIVEDTGSTQTGSAVSKASKPHKSRDKPAQRQGAQAAGDDKTPTQALQARKDDKQQQKQQKDDKPGSESKVQGKKQVAKNFVSKIVGKVASGEGPVDSELSVTSPVTSLGAQRTQEAASTTSGRKDGAKTRSSRPQN